MINVGVSVKDVCCALKETSLTMPKIERKVLTIIGKNTIKEMKPLIPKRSGMLKAAYKYHVDMEKEQVSCYPKAGSDASYYKGESYGRKVLPIASSINYGGEIKAKKDYLYFVKGGEGGAGGEGKLARVKCIRIQGHHFVERGEKYMRGGGWHDEAVKMVDKELKKYWG